MSATDDLVGWFELHDQAQIRAALSAGASATALIDGKRPVDLLIEMYTRSPAFAGCLRVLLDAGASIGDPVLEALLLDDLPALTAALAADAQAIDRRLSLPCAYTSLQGVSALHVCAEYNSVRCARALLDAGLDVNTRAAIDAEGLGGHTPIFHAVNSNQNHCRPVLEVLTAAGADLDLRVRGLVWGGGFEWETVIFDVSPISYAQCGLYAQFHRREQDVYSNLDHLYQRRFGTAAPFRNVPNKYLRH